MSTLTIEKSNLTDIITKRNSKKTVINTKIGSCKSINELNV